MTVQILDQHGAPLRPSAEITQGRAPSHYPATAYRGADGYSQELAGWSTQIYSADSAALPEREALAARAADLVRNNGYLKGALQSLRDLVVGQGLRLSAAPDHRALGITPEAALELGKWIEMEWRNFAEGLDNWVDARRRFDLHGLAVEAFHSWFTQGEALALPLWLPKPHAPDAYATTIQTVDPARLSQPHDRPDEPRFRGGIEMDELGAPIAYHIRQGHPGELDMMTAAGDHYTWERVPRFVEAEGLPAPRLQVLHLLPPGGVGQTRGVSVMASILECARLLDRMDNIETVQAMVQAMYATTIESAGDPALIAEALGAEGSSPLVEWGQYRKTYYDEKDLRQTGVKIPPLAPGDKLNFQTASSPRNNYDAFQQVMLRRIAAGTGMSYEFLARDWSKVNYSSARAGLLEVWRFATGRRSMIARQFYAPIYLLFLEEAFETGRIDPPRGAPEFQEARAAYTRAKWIGPGFGWIDPVKEVQAAGLRMQAGLSTLQDEAGEQGRDWEESVDQRAREEAYMRERGVTPPDWMQVQSLPSSTDNEGEGRSQGEGK